MKFMRKNKHPLTEKEATALNKLIADCRADGTGEKAKWVVYRLLNEALPYEKLVSFSLVSGFCALSAQFNANSIWGGGLKPIFFGGKIGRETFENSIGGRHGNKEKS